MKRFRFRLDSVLRWRAHRLDRRRRELAEVTRRLQRHDARRDALASEVDAAEQELQNRTALGIQSAEAQNARAGIDAGRQHERVMDFERDAIHQDARKARKEMSDAHTQLRALEVLRERAQQAHRRSAQRVEQHELDEVAGRMRQPQLRKAGR